MFTHTKKLLTKDDFRKIKYIALDLDGTTLASDGSLSDFTKKTLEDAMDAGYKIIVASGRPYKSLPKHVLSIPGISYAITSNGAEVYDVPSQTKLIRHVLGKTAIEQVLELTKNEPVSYEAFIHGHAFADSAYIKDPVKFGATKEAVSYIQATRTAEDDIKKFIFENIENIESLDVVVRDLSDNKRILHSLKEKVPGVYITSSVRQLVEISDKNSGKHSALTFLSTHAGFAKENVISFGNADNDVDLLNYGAYGFAVANASPACLKAADIITPSNDEEGVAQALREFLQL